MTTRAQIVAEARSWIGTPFKHQGRLKGVGVDCAGLIEMVPKSLGLYPDARIMPYRSYPDSRAMRSELLKHLEPINLSAAEPGDVLWFRVELEGQHLAIITKEEGYENQMVHAFGRPKIMRCIEQRLGAYWRDRIVGCFRYRGVE